VIVALYAQGGVLPVAPVPRGSDARRSHVPTLAEEESAECEFGEPIVDGDRAAVEWWAETKLKDGRREKLAGVSLLRFNADGLVIGHSAFWASA
jgi:hypothetical protein